MVLGSVAIAALFYRFSLESTAARLILDAIKGVVLSFFIRKLSRIFLAVFPRFALGAQVPKPYIFLDHVKES